MMLRLNKECRVSKVYDDDGTFDGKSFIAVFDDASFDATQSIKELPWSVVEAHLPDYGYGETPGMAMEIADIAVGRVRLLKDALAFRQAFQRFAGNLANGYTSEKAA